MPSPLRDEQSFNAIRNPRCDIPSSPICDCERPPSLKQSHRNHSFIWKACTSIEVAMFILALGLMFLKRMRLMLRAR